MDPSGHLLIEYAVNLAETTVVYAGLGEMFGVVSAYLCGQNLLEGAKAGFWIGAAFGSGGILAPEMTAAVGAGMGLYGLGTSLYDMSVNGITFCNLFNALGSALLVKGSVEVLTPGSLHPNDKLNSFDLSPELNRASSDSKGNSIDPAELAQIIAELKKEGVEVDMGKEFEQLLAMENKEAQYIPRKNRPGLIVLGENPSRSAVYEELIHLDQDRSTGWKLYVQIYEELSEMDALILTTKLEIEANQRLYEIGRQLNFPPDEQATTAKRIMAERQKLQRLLGK